MEIFKLFGSIFVNNEDANEKLDNTEKKAGSVASKLGEGVKTAAKWGTAIVGGATAAVGGLLAATNKTAEYADEIDKLSERTGINREELQRWKYAAGQSGADVGKLEVGIKKLSDQMDGAVNGNKAAIEAFGKLGISLDDLKNKSQEEIFGNVMNALADMEQGATRNALGNDLLGKSYTEMLPLLNAGSQGMQELKDRADELGIVMSEDAVKANVKFGDTLADVKDAFGGIVRDLTDSMLPMLQGFIDYILSNMPMIQDVLGSVMGALGDSVAAVLPLLMDLIQNALPPIIDLFTQIASDILPPVIGLCTDILQAVLPPLIELFSGIITTILPPLIDLLTVIINDILPPFIQLFNDVISTVLPPLMDLFSQIIKTLLPPLIELFSQIIDAIMPVIIELFTTFSDTVLPPLMELINEIVQVILPPLLDLFNDLAQVVLPLVISVFESLQPLIEPCMNAIAAAIKTVLSLIKGDWEGVWNGIKEFFGSALDYYVKLVEGFKTTFVAIFNGIGDAITAVWDNIVNGVKGAINWIISGINTFIRGINSIKVPDWVPGVGGKGINIKEIPMLANGGEIIQSGKALVGEKGPEILDLPTGAKVIPLKKDQDSESSKPSVSIHNEFRIENMEVRDDSDIKRIAVELHDMQEDDLRGIGVVPA